VLPVDPRSRSNTRRGWFSVGSGVVEFAQATVLLYAQLYPPSQLPAASLDSSVNSIDDSCVSRPNSRATIWSSDTPF
jgi:hypothetical protein